MFPSSLNAMMVAEIFIRSAEAQNEFAIALELNATLAIAN
jgi:hypothetical protein